MDFLQTLKAHRGRLICLKTALFWYGGRGFDDSPGRICLLLDASARTSARAASPTRSAAAMTATADATAAAALLLIDDRPQWIWVSRADMELIA